MAKSIELYYSGAKNFQAPQVDVNLSLGGYPSSTALSKNLKNALFSEISSLDLKSRNSETIAIFLKNNGGEPIPSLKFKQIYSRVFGVNNMYCKFEWGVSGLNESNFIELIGSKRETPYHSEFFEPDYVREDAFLKITNAGATGDAIQIIGKDITLSGNTIETLISDIVLAFKDSLVYKVKKFSDTEIYFESHTNLFDGLLIELITPGNAAAENTNFKNGKEDIYELIEGEPLAVGGYIGLWIKKIFIPIDELKEIAKVNKIENLEIKFEY